MLTIGCGYNEVIDRDQDVETAWAEVHNQYKRRADLVPNLVSVVRGAAEFERETLEAVVKARSQVQKVSSNPSSTKDTASMRQFLDAQSSLGGALSRLMAVVERYPKLESTAAFRDLQVQIEGSENRIAVARRRYIEAVGDYNKVVLSFPSSIGAQLRGMQKREQFSTDAKAAEPPKVEF